MKPRDADRDVIRTAQGITAIAALDRRSHRDPPPYEDPRPFGAPNLTEPPHSRIYTLRELLERPEILQPPAVVAPRMAWKQRLTVFAGPPKAGKTTLAIHAAAAVSVGRDFLGQRTPRGVVLHVVYEGHMDDVVRSYAAADADPDSVHIAQGEPGSPARLAEMIAEARPVVTLIDTLTSYFVGLVADAWRAEQVTPHMNGLTAMAQQLDTAIVAIAHTPKAGGGPADSRAIAAGADMILVMDAIEMGDPSPRRAIKAVGRWPMKGYSVRLEDGRYLLDDVSDVPVDLLVLDYIRAHPGIGSGKLRSGVGRRFDEVDAAVKRLLARGLIADEGSASAHKFSAAETAPQAVPEKSAGNGFGNGGWDRRNTRSDNTLTDTGTTPRSRSPDTSIGNGTRAEAGTTGYPCPGGCGETFSVQLSTACVACRQQEGVA